MNLTLNPYQITIKGVRGLHKFVNRKYFSQKLLISINLQLATIIATKTYFDIHCHKSNLFSKFKLD